MDDIFIKMWKVIRMSDLFYAVNEDDEVWSNTCPFECLEECIENMYMVDEIEVGMVIELFQGESTPAVLDTKINFTDRLYDYNEDIHEDAIDKVVGELRDLGLDEFISEQIQKFMQDNNVKLNWGNIINITPLYYRVKRMADDEVKEWEECTKEDYKKYWIK